MKIKDLRAKNIDELEPSNIDEKTELTDFWIQESQGSEKQRLIEFAKRDAFFDSMEKPRRDKPFQHE